MLVNGEELDPISFQRTSAYLMQDDVMFAHLTVREQARLAFLCLFFLLSSAYPLLVDLLLRQVATEEYLR